MLLKLKPQLWIDWAGTGRPPQIAKPIGDDHRHRPTGGLWTSSYEGGSSAFVERMRLLLTRQPIVKRPAWILEPKEADIWEIRDRLAELDLMAFAPGFPVWSQIAEKFDGVHMTEEGARAFWHTPLPDDPMRPIRLQALVAATEAELGSPLDMWETESTWWVRWCFKTCKRIGLIDVPQLPPGPRPGPTGGI